MRVNSHKISVYKRVLLPAALLVFLTACTPKPSATVLIDPALASLVPTDTVLLAGVRLEPLRSTPLYQQYVLQKKIPQLENWVRETGFDPRKDLWELLFVSDAKDSLAMARGKFSEMGLEPKLEREGARRSSYQGYTMLGSDESAVVFLNSSTAVAGTQAALRRLIDRRNTSGGVPPSLLSDVARIPSSNQLWVVAKTGGRLPAAIPLRGPLSNFTQFAERVESVTGFADLRNGLNLSVAGQAPSSADAKKIHDALRGVLGFARLSTPQDRAELLRAYDNLEIKIDQKTVRLHAELSTQLVGEVLAEIERR